MEKLKLEMARELGLFDKVMAGGWKNLTSKESGRIGGKISAKLRNKDAEKNKSKKN
ncbi:alpha/beta-type small acid-soluble spore protein [Lachnospiraceae bacterium NSJ-143]|nr:alpha/beta-type small acid-soluble spore protein [Lachnospiraceae bacterium NSJ-143]